MKCFLQTCLYILACMKIAKSLHPKKHGMLAVIDGNLILGGLFSLHRRHLDMECANHTSPRNIMRVEAMLYAVEEVNNG